MTAVHDAHRALLEAVGPVAEALGGTVLPPAAVEPTDIPLRWQGELAGGLRLPPDLLRAADVGLHGALGRLIEQVEEELGGRLAELSREDKQRAVRLLDEGGAFLLRRSVEEVADALGVSRITVYNYLNAVRP